MFVNARTISRPAALLLLLAAPVAPAAEPALSYPSTRKIDTVDDFHGTRVPDPYRWLEDLGSPDTASFIETQNKLAFAYLGKIQAREAIEKRLTELWNYPRTNVPFREAGQLFYRQNTGLQQQSPLYVRASVTAEERLLLDPNTLSKDGSDRPLPDLGVPRREVPRVRPGPGRRRLADDPRPRDRHRQGPRRPRGVVPLLRDLLDEGRQGLLLLALPRAPQGPGALRRAPASPPLLPPRGNAPVGGPTRLRAPGQPALVHLERHDGGRTLPDRLPPAGVGPPEPVLLRGPRRSPEAPARRPRRADRGRVPRPVRRHRQPRPGLHRPDRPRSAEAPRDRDRPPAQGGPGGMEDAHFRDPLPAGGSGDGGRQDLRRLPRGREEPGGRLSRWTGSARASSPCPG